MTYAMPKTANRVRQISELVSKLPANEQETLLASLRKRMVQEQAERLAASVKPNSISMQEVVEEVRLVRKLWHEST